MTRNNFGGTKHKKTARKNNNNNSNFGLRKSNDPDELYARAIKLYGNGMIEVLAQDNIKYLGIIRQKFSGKKKIGNTINVGTYLLIGKRSFETQIEGRKMKADILEIYDTKEIRKLEQEEVKVDWKVFYNHILDKNENNDYAFEDDETNRGRQLLNELEENDENDEKEYQLNILDKSESESESETEYEYKSQAIKQDYNLNKNKNNKKGNIILFNNQDDDINIDDI